MLGFLGKLFGGSKSEKDVKIIQPIVAEINKYFQQYESLTNDQLRGKTQEFRQRIKDHLRDIDIEIEQRKQAAEALDVTDIQGKDAIYQEVDKLKKDRDQKIEEALTEIQAEAFAVVKETAKRFTNNTEIISSATQLDRDLSVRKEHIRI